MVAGLPIVAFRSKDGSAIALDRRCCHLGSDLAAGRVVDGCIECPLHGWRYDVTGRCVTIACGEPVPAWAGQRAFPVAEQHGQVFVFRGRDASYPFPGFDGVAPEEMLPARPFTLRPACSWSMIAANGFDMQHFRTSHDRMLRGTPTLSRPHRSALRINFDLEIVPDSVADRVLRRIAGPYVSFQVTSWSGTLVHVVASFARTTSYGLVAVVPVSPRECVVHDTVLIRRRRGRVSRVVLDPVDLAVRRWFIHRFVSSDLHRVTGIRFSQSRTIDADRELTAYFAWLRRFDGRDADGAGASEHSLSTVEDCGHRLINGATR